MIYIEVLYDLGQWHVVQYNATVDRSDILASYDRKCHAVAVGKFYARHLADETGLPIELTIKNRAGKIREKNTYGYDPEESVG